MTQLVWDAIGERVYEAGVDRGVLYPPNGASGVAWNGLTGVVEDRSDGTSTPYYLDGVKYLNVPSPSDYSATLTAFTFPDEFLPFDGVADAGNGLLLDSQVPKPFRLSYRTLIGNDVDNLDYGYKIHLLYDLTAVPTSRSYVSSDSNISPLIFSWAITGIPQIVTGFRPTIHAVLDSRKISSTILAQIEEVLYGTFYDDPILPDLYQLIILLTSTSDIEDGGSPSLSGLDILDGGTPFSSGSDSADGGAVA